MPESLRIAKDLDLPIDLVTLTQAILGIRGSGKTNTAVVEVEEALKRGVHTVVIDPLDVWWGLKASKTGKSEGFPITVLGGHHGDMPLLDTDGQAIANAVVEHSANVILSLRHLSKNGRRRFVADFAEQLYARKGEAGRDTPVFVVIDEADSFVPQKVYTGSERMVGAIDDLVRRGRASGIGVTLISQRASVVNKDVLTQIEILVAHRHTSPQDRHALDAWVEQHGDQERRAEFMRDLGKLPVGTAYLWSPGWLDLFRKVRIRERETFDSSATPKIGERRIEPKKLAAVDLDQFRAQLAESIAQAEARDPAALRRALAEKEARIRDLTATAERYAQAAAQSTAPPGLAEAIDEVERLVETAMASLVGRLKDVETIADDVAGRVRTRLLDARARLAGTPTGVDVNWGAPRFDLKPDRLVVGTASTGSGAARPTSRRAAAGPYADPNLVGALSASQRAILNGLAFLASTGNTTPTKGAVAFAAGAIASSAGFKKNVGLLASWGLIARAADRLSLTSKGEAGADDRPLLAGSADQQRAAIYQKVGETRAAILRVVADAGPRGVERDRLAQKAGQAETPEGFKKNLGILRSLDLIDYQNGAVVATENLVPSY